MALVLLLEEQELECSPTAGSRDGCTARDALGMQSSKDAESPTRIWKAEIVLGLIILYVCIIEGTLATARNPRPRPPNTMTSPPNAQRPNAATNNETAGNPYRPHDMITRHFPKLKTISLEQLGHMINALALPSRFFRMITVTMWNATDTTICICSLMELATRRCSSAGVRMHHWP